GNGAVAVSVGLDHGHQAAAGRQGFLENFDVVAERRLVQLPPGTGFRHLHGVLLVRIRDGCDTTVLPSGISVCTTAPAPILTPLTMLMPPTTTPPALMSELSPMVGACWPISPMVRFW